MNRREFSLTTLGTLGLSVGLPGLALAQDAPVEGKQYVRLYKAAPVSAPAGKVEVVEFFWYGCGHCNDFEPTLAAWAAKLPADVVFRRVPVAFRKNPFVNHQRLFYALEAMGLVSSLHAKVFRAIHAEGQTLDNPETIAAFMTRQGVDAAKFMAMFNSFAVQTKCKQAGTLADAYKIDGVPTLGIAGRYFTSVSLNGNPERTLATTNFLIDQARKGR